MKSQDAGIWPGNIGAANPPARKPAPPKPTPPKPTPAKPEIIQTAAAAKAAATTAVAATADANRDHATTRVPNAKTIRPDREHPPDDSVKAAPHSGQVYLPNYNPHQPLILTWQVLGPALDQVLFTTSKIAPPGTWWPDLAFCLKQIIPTSIPPNQVRSYGFYCCPEHNKQTVCGGPASHYCAKWSCVSSNDGDWKWDSEYTHDRATFSFENSGPGRYVIMEPYKRSDCRSADLDRIRIKFTDAGKNYDTQAWMRGMRWGVVFNNYNNKPGSSVMVRLSLSSPPAQPVGPNVLAKEPPSTSNTPIPPDTENRLFSLIQGAFLVLNRTNPNVTQSCWLCYASSPPYYEGIAQTRGYNKTTDSSQCPWGENRKLTLTAVSGSGLCLGQVPHDKQHLCNQTQIVQPTEGNQYLVPPLDTAWACNTGLTPCVSTSVFNTSKDYCILVQLVPRLLYHDDSSFIDEFDHRGRWKREPITLTFAVLMGLGIAAGVGTGAAALIQTPQYYEELRAAMDTDLRSIEQSITKLEESLTSLSEVVLQNRRGLDLLFLKEGGLCAALKEECCFYVDHSGVIKDSMAKLRERLDIRKKEREDRQGWFESWFNKSPWLTTLLSTLVGPIIILMLLLTFGPCIINRLVTFIKERVSAVQVLVLRQQYQELQWDEQWL